MKTLYLIPPSEGKNAHPLTPSLVRRGDEEVSFYFEKPCEIAISATEKDLKCKGKRYEEGIELNKQLCDAGRVRMHSYPTMQAIDRYSWVMFNAIDYASMSVSGKKFFEENFLILSGMYGVLKPLDTIWNYKLPIESKWLLDFWWTQIIEALNNAWVTKVVNLLPESYAKLIYWKNKTQAKVFTELRKFEIEDKIFYKPNWSRMAHWVKKVKGEWIKEVCEGN